MIISLEFVNDASLESGVESLSTFSLLEMGSVNHHIEVESVHEVDEELADEIHSNALLFHSIYQVLVTIDLFEKRGIS